MTSPKGMDELLWDEEFEDVHDWVERVEMIVEVKGINAKKLFKIGRFNLKGKLKEWFKKMAIVPINWQTMKTTMLLKYETEDKEEIKVKLDLIKQEPKQQVYGYYDKIGNLFTRSKLKDVEHKRRFPFQFYFEIMKLCVM